MNVHRYDAETHKRADRLHDRAQQTGRAEDYTAAADLYERCGMYEKARVCREAAEVAK